MEYVRLNNGMILPMVGFGTWDLRGKQCEAAVGEAIGLGYRLIDTAQMYGNEEAVSAAIRYCGVARQELVITTKVYEPNASYDRTKASMYESLEKLGLDYIDLMLIHEPYEAARDMYRALREGLDEGVLRAIGVSNFHKPFFEDFITDCGVIPAVNQVEAHVFHSQAELQACLAAHGTGMEAWSPFAAGKEDIFHNPVLQEVGRHYGKSAAQIALKYLVQRGMVVIPKSAHVERMQANLELFDFQLSVKNTAAVAGLDRGKSLFGWY